MHIVLAAAMIGLLFHTSPLLVADHLTEEKLFPGQSEDHGQCMAKVLDAAVRAAAAAAVRDEARPLEHTRVVAFGIPGSTSFTIDLLEPDTKEWRRIAVSCEGGTLVQRFYVIDRPASIEPPAPNMRDLRRHVMQTYPSHDQCVADLLSIALLALGATSFQEGSDRNPHEQMRLIFSDGVVWTEMGRQDNAGEWFTTTGTCVDRREIVVDRTTIGNPPTSK